MEFSNSGRGEIIYQKDTHPSLGRVALKLLSRRYTLRAAWQSLRGS